MKKLFTTFAILFFVVSFAYRYRMQSSTRDNLNKEGTVKKSNQFGLWGPWRTTSCYRGLDFRVRRTQEDSFNGPKYEWEAQFRNRYEDVINFNFKITYPGDESPTGDRQSINANETTNGEDWALTTDGETCEVLVDKVRFGDDDGSKAYIPCGN